MKYLVRFFASKYLIALVAFAVWVTFFDSRDVFSQLDRRKELHQLNTKITYYHQQIQTTRDELKNLQNDTLAMERYAREKYFMKKDNEDVFIEEQ